MKNNLLAVDASVVAKWMWPEEDSQQAMALYDDMAWQFIAPDFLLAEMTNMLWKKIKQETLLPEQAQTLLKTYQDSIIIRFHPFAGYLERALALTTLLQHNSIYDCIYLALAEQQQCRLLTADQRFLDRLKKTDYAHLGVSLKETIIH